MIDTSALAQWINSFKITTLLGSLVRQLWKYLDFIEVPNKVDGCFKHLFPIDGFWQIRIMLVPIWKSHRWEPDPLLKGFTIKSSERGDLGE